MSTPMVEPVTVRDVPLIVDENYANRGKYSQNSGFPFEDAADTRDHPFRSRLDDLAQRHPEFAEHLTDFPFRRSDSWGRSANRRGSQNEPTSASAGEAFPEGRRFAERPFGSRFDRFGFPFSSRFDRPEFFADYQPGYQQQEPESKPAPAQAQQHRQPEQKPQRQEEGGVSKPPQAPDNRNSRKANNPNLPQSNTVDLGQKQEPVDDNRSQRSMSAPPDNRSGKRFVSSINIPINRDGGGGGESNMGSKQSQPEPQPQTNQNQQQQQRERVIPIHVEGRDEPVVPKNAQQANFSQPPPHAERVFGQKPSTFTKFVPPKQQPPQQQRAPPQQSQQQHQTPPPPPPQQQQSQQKPSQIEQIQLIQKDVLELMSQVEKFGGKPRDKQYLYLDEMLTRNLIKLDNIDTEGKDNIRQARKEAIKCIERCISLLESKAAANVGETAPRPEEPMEVEAKNAADGEKIETDKPEQQNQAATAEESLSKLEVSGLQRSGSQVKMEVAAPEKGAQEEGTSTTMEVVPEENADAEVSSKASEATPMEVANPVEEASSQANQDESKEGAGDCNPKEKKKGKKKEKAAAEKM